MYELFELEDCKAETGLQLLYVTWFRYEKEWYGTRHTHNFLEIFFCVGGDCEFHVRDTVFQIHPRQFVVINPGVEHVERAIPSAPVEWIVLGVKGLQSDLVNNSDGYYHGNFISDHKVMVTLLVNLVNELKNKDLGYTEASLRIVQLLLIYVARSSGANIGLEKVPMDRLHSSIVWVKQYIDDNYTASLNLAMLSDKVGLNRYGLIREFKKLYGVSPIEYMLRCRYRQAKFLLETTDCSIVNISRDLGFSSGNYFSQGFQKRFGMTASAYRATHGGQ